MRISVTSLVTGLVLAIAGCTSTPEPETNLTTSELEQLLIGKSVRLDYGGMLRYYENGRYEYHLQQPPRFSRGTYFFSDNQICVDFDGPQRCDAYVRRGDYYYFANRTNGRKFRVIRISTLQDGGVQSDTEQVPLD